MKPSVFAFLLVISCTTSPQLDLAELPAGHPARVENSTIHRSVTPTYLAEDETTRGTARRLKTEEHADKAPSENTAAMGSYTCPMHPEVHQNGPGDCPICGMKLVPEKPQSNSP